MDGDTVKVESAFADTEKTFIGWEGDWYYRGCGEPVVTNEDGSGSHCVKRVDHPGDIHEDYNGIRKSEKSGKMLVIVSFAQPTASPEDYAHTSAILHALKPHFANESDVQVTLAIRELADEILMIVKGDG